MNLENILDQSKQLIDVKNNLHPAGNLSTTFLNNLVEENIYVRILYGPKTIYNHT